MHTNNRGVEVDRKVCVCVCVYEGGHLASSTPFYLLMN